MSSAEDLLKEAEVLISEATKRGIILRALGGVAIRYHCPSAGKPPLARDIADIDLFGLSKQSAAIKRIFIDLSYSPAETFNALRGNKRLMFFEPKTHVRRDVFLDFFELCHKFDFRKRLEVESFSIPIADLLMTKLQVVEIEERDYKDIVCILIDHDLAERDTNDAINREYITGMCSNNWGIYKTFTQNLEKTLGYLEKVDLNVADKKLVQERINALAQAIETVPKSSRWKMRSLIGDRVSWYEEPEAPKALKFAEK